MSIAYRIPSRTAKAVPQTAAREPTQLRVGQIVAVWAAASLPMAALAWIVAPAIAGQLDGTRPLVRALLITLTAGLVWQFVLVMGLVYREQGTLRWPVVREALWLRRPHSPKTGRRGGRVWFVLIPLLFGVAAMQEIPNLPIPDARDWAAFMQSDAAETLFAGSWGWFALLVTMAVFNTVIGEELLFRGYLLPRMAGAFGRRDWVVNGVLHATYHLHMPWHIPAALFNMFVLAYPSKRYRSALMGIAVHSAQSVVIIGLTLSLVLA